MWTTSPSLEAWLAISSTEQAELVVPTVRERLMQFCATLHGACGVACHRADELPFHDEVDAARLVGRCANELQSVISGTRVCHVHVERGSEPCLYKVVIGFEFESLARECLETAERFIAAVASGAPFDVAAAVEQLNAHWRDCRPTALQRELVLAARANGVPMLRLPTDQFQQLGWGSRQRRFMSNRSDRTSAIAETIAGQAETTCSLLKSAGIAFAESGDPHFSLLVIGGQAVVGVRHDDEQLRDVTGSLTSEWTSQAVDAVRAVGLDIGMVRIASRELNEPMRVLEVAVQPDLDALCGISPTVAQRIGSAIIETMFPGHQNGRIPIACVTGTNGKTTTTRMIAHTVALTGKRVGMTCTDGIYVNGRRIDHDDCSGPRSARNVLMNPTIDAAILETARGGMLREGLAFDRCDVAVVMNIGEGDHLGLNDIHTPQQLARVKRIIVTAVSKSGTAVLKADDPLVAEMASHCPGNTIFFCLDADHPVMVEHRAAGGRVVFVRDNFMVLAEGSLEIPLLSVDRIPLTHGGRILFQVENALATTAANWALGTPAEIIRNGLESFAASIDTSPGRFNLLEMGGATVVVDYGHNTSSLAAMLDALALFPHRNRVAVYSAAGDRRDSDMIRQGEMLGNAFDRVLIYEDQYVRGREPGDIMRLFQQGLTHGRRVRDAQSIQGWENAAEQALKSLRPGDLLLLQADTIDEAVALVNRHLASDVDIHEVTMKASLDPAPAVPAVVPAQPGQS